LERISFFKLFIMMNPFDNTALVEGYEAWYENAGLRADRLEKTLLRRLLAGFPTVHTLLEVGCGTGHFTRWYDTQDLQVLGLDISAPMLAEAVRYDSPPCMQGDALSLPFPTNAFDIVALITTLEFVPEPVPALADALRVARYGLILGVLNRQSVLGWQLQQAGGPVWEAAHFYTPGELVKTMRKAVGDSVEFVWWTTLWPITSISLHLPWGGFIGMAVKKRRWV
jgi:ubiquinone/menaquinone biosynthesis C-methylase UbiE